MFSSLPSPIARRCVGLLAVQLTLLAPPIRAEETDKRASVCGTVATGAMAFHQRDDHYAPLIFRGWLWAVAGEAQAEGRLGRLTVAGTYATGGLDAGVPRHSARLSFKTLSFGFDRALLRREIHPIPFRLFAGVGLRSTNFDTDFGDNPAAPGSPFRSFLWSHSAWVGVGADARVGTRATVAAHVETSLASHVARPAYGLATGDVSPFAGRWYSPGSAFQAGAEVRARIRLTNHVGVGAGYVFHTLRAPDPLPVRAYHHAFMVNLDGSL